MNKTYKIIILITSIIIALILAEILLRAFEPKEEVSNLYVKSNNQILGFELTKNYISGKQILLNGKTHYDTDSKDYIKINSEGFRGDEITKTNKSKIVIIGDSIAFGYNIIYKKSFVNVLRKKLPDYQIINLAVPGYSAIQELQILKKAKEYNPVLIVWQYALNDPKDLEGFPLTVLSYEEIRDREDAIIQLLNQSENCQLKNNLQRSRLLINILNIVEKVTKHHIGLLYHAGYDFEYYHSEPCGKERLQKVFKELGNKDNPKILVTMFPAVVEYKNYPFYNIHERIKNLSLENNLYYYDTLDVLKGFSHDQIKISDADEIHFNENTNQVIGLALAKKINELLVR